MTVEKQQIQVGSARIYFEATGSGPPLVLVHGLAASGRWWKRNIPALAERFRVYAPDLPGFGASRGCRFVLADAAAHLAGWMDRLGIGQAGVIGHSMGGFIAAQLAADYPRKVNHLVLVSAAALPLRRSFPRQLWCHVRSVRRTPWPMLPTMLADGWRCGTATSFDAGRQVLASDISEKVRGIRTPALLVWGDRDAIVPPEIGRQLAKVLPTARLLLIRGAGHVPMWTNPQLFNDAVLGFLQNGEW